ncbi:phospholipase D family protein [Metabacillus indicus]|uniref:phospholipase D family protein n=1 Tax=Metabacillus indicus TaxID=246786 RepID=UPI002A02550F|nr:phospholipase D family protein [Metabacillus indicus]MDX8291681.1 phospholipase D family protein [Metabacillus indicus]
MSRSKFAGYKKKRLLVILLILIVLTGTVMYQSYKPLPDGLSYEGKVRKVEDVDFLYDLTYQKENRVKSDRMIFDAVLKAIDDAEEFVVIDLFLFNGYYNKGESYPDISAQLTEALLQKKKENPDMPIVFITDEINTSYGSHKSKELEAFKDAGIDVVLSDMEPLRDSNPLYSSVWRTFFQWFGQSGKGWVTNPFGDTAPDMTVRSYLKLFNVKANHRKAVATEKTAIVSSANPHDASGFHSNTALQVSGNVIADVLESEQAVSDYSGGPKLPEYTESGNEKGNIDVQVLTEGKIYEHLLSSIRAAEKNDVIWMGMFYLADRKVIDSLVEASNRGVKVNMILDPNQNAFGQEKIGLPNRPVAEELMEDTKKKAKIRWYNTTNEQYHPKLLYIKGKKKSTIISGSANFTKRNLDDLNLENDLKISAPQDEDVMKEVEAYFTKLWTNDGAEYTLNVEKYRDDMPVFKRGIYALQKFFRFTTF